ncbi:MAG TPA: peroxiredoxin-like family protein [Methylomirabilota bacterium]|jgi:peroxiredoxin|nr:peroxiredoxin-like family protein [Methylomirabilota bacterium]
MASGREPHAIQVGDVAPDFALPAAHEEGTVTLSACRARSPVLLALFRGLYCPFCRRQIAQLAVTAPKLAKAGIQVVGVVAAEAERARMYFRIHPPGFPMAADTDMRTHRAWGLRVIARDEQSREMIEIASRRMARELSIPLGPGEARAAISGFDGFEPLAGDMADRERHQIQTIGQFLIDCDGIVRWRTTEDTAGYAVFADERQLLSLGDRVKP